MLFTQSAKSIQMLYQEESYDFFRGIGNSWFFGGGTPINNKKGWLSKKLNVYTPEISLLDRKEDVWSRRMTYIPSIWGRKPISQLTPGMCTEI